MSGSDIGSEDEKEEATAKQEEKRPTTYKTTLKRPSYPRSLSGLNDDNNQEQRPVDEQPEKDKESKPTLSISERRQNYQRSLSGSRLVDEDKQDGKASDSKSNITTHEEQTGSMTIAQRRKNYTRSLSGGRLVEDLEEGTTTNDAELSHRPQESIQKTAVGDSDSKAPSAWQGVLSSVKRTLSPQRASRQEPTVPTHKTAVTENAHSGIQKKKMMLGSKHSSMPDLQSDEKHPISEPVEGEGHQQTKSGRPWPSRMQRKSQTAAQSVRELVTAHQQQQSDTQTGPQEDSRFVSPPRRPKQSEQPLTAASSPRRRSQTAGDGGGPPVPSKRLAKAGAFLRRAWSPNKRSNSQKSLDLDHEPPAGLASGHQYETNKTNTSVANPVSFEKEDTNRVTEGESGEGENDVPDQKEDYGSRGGSKVMKSPFHTFSLKKRQERARSLSPNKRSLSFRSRKKNAATEAAPEGDSVKTEQESKEDQKEEQKQEQPNKLPPYLFKRNQAEETVTKISPEDVVEANPNQSRGDGAPGLRGKLNRRDSLQRFNSLSRLSITDEPKKGKSLLSSQSVIDPGPSEHEDEKPKTAPPAAPVSNKIPKMVKSLQSGCFMAGEHVPGILRDCLSFIQGKGKGSDPNIDKTELQLQLGQSNSAVFSIITMMNRCEDDAVVQELCCAIIQELCRVHDTNRSRVTTEGGLQAVLVALLKHEHSMEVQINGLAAMATLALNEGNRDLIPEMRRLDVLKTCMEAYVMNISVQTEACRIITALTTDHAKNSKAMGALRLGKAIVGLMFAHPEAGELQEQACVAIRAMTANDDMNHASLLSADVLEAVLTAMKTFDENLTLQAAACGVLWNLTSFHGTVEAIQAYDSSRGSSRNDNCIRILLLTLRAHDLDPAVQEAGCGTLKHLTERHEAQKLLTGQAGVLVVPTILNAMRQHQSVKGVQTQGCGALCNLAMVEEHKGPILNAGGISMIIGAMRELQDSIEVQKQGCRALRTLTATNAPTTGSSHHGNSNHSTGTSTNSTLGSGGDSSSQAKISIAAAGGIVVLLKAMERYADIVGVQVLALGVLQQLLTVPRNRGIVLSNDGVRVLEQIRELHCPRQVHVDKATREILQLVQGGPGEPAE